MVSKVDKDDISVLHDHCNTRDNDYHTDDADGDSDEDDSNTTKCHNEVDFISWSHLTCTPCQR